jgi:hypothetical protein
LLGVTTLLTRATDAGATDAAPVTGPLTTASPPLEYEDGVPSPAAWQVGQPPRDVERRLVLAFGARYAVGRAEALGADVLHAHEQTVTQGFDGFLRSYLAYGVSGQLHARHWESVDAGSLGLQVRGAVVGAGGGVALELTGAWLRGDSTDDIGILPGAYVSWYFLELGVVTSLTFKPRPDWLSPVAFSVRLQLPAVGYAAHRVPPDDLRGTLERGSGNEPQTYLRGPSPLRERRRVQINSVATASAAPPPVERRGGSRHPQPASPGRAEVLVSTASSSSSASALPRRSRATTEKR